MANDCALAVAESLCARWEGFMASPYLCPAGVPTIGYGFTRYPDGRAVTLLDPPITRDEAKRILRQLVATKYLPAVQRLCPYINATGRVGAIVDFAYNLGVGNLRTSTLRRKVNADAWDEVPAQLRRWVRAGGRVLRGLVLRREAEIAYV